MSGLPNPTSRICWRSRLVVATALLLAVLLFLTWPWGVPVLLPSLGLPLIAIVLVPAVTVRSDGISLYAVNHLNWSEIVAASATRVAGLPYAVVQRRRGMKWWIPLYVDDRRGLLSTLKSKAPAGSALQVFAATVSN